MAAPNNASNSNKQRSSIFQPIGDFLRTDFVIGKIFVASNTVWISLIFLVLSITFFLIGYATVGWGRADSPDGARRNVGLWQECHSSTGCRYYGGNDISSGFQATQAFATLALIGLIAAVASAIFYVFSITYQRKQAPGVALFISRMSTVVFLLLVISIFPSTWAQGRYQANDTSTQYSYALVVTAFVTELMGCFLMALEIFYVRDFCCGPAQSTTYGYYSNAHAHHETRLHDPEPHPRQEDIAIDNAAFQEEAYHQYEDPYGDRRKSNPIEEYMMYIEQEGKDTSRDSRQLERGYERYDDQAPPPQPQAPPRKKGGKRLSFKRSSKRRSKSKERGKNARYETLQPETNSPVAPGYDRLNGAVVAGTSPKPHGDQQYVVPSKEYPQQHRSASQSNLEVQPVPQQTGGVYKKTDHPGNTPRRYSQTGATKLEQAPGTPNSTRGKYEQAPGTPSSTRGKYEQPSGTPGSTPGSAPGSTHGKYEQASSTPSRTREKYEQAPGAPSSTRGNHEHAPGAPGSTRGSYEQASGRPTSSTTGSKDTHSDTQSSRKYQQASSPGRTSTSSTPSSPPGKANQPLGYPASGHGAPLGYPSSTGPRGSRQMLAAKSEPYLHKDGGKYSSTQSVHNPPHYSQQRAQSTANLYPQGGSTSRRQQPTAAPPGDYSQQRAQSTANLYPQGGSREDGGKYSSTQSVNNPHHYSQQRAQSTANLYPQGGSTSRRQQPTAAPPGDYSAGQHSGAPQASPRRASTSSDKVFSIYTNQTPAGTNTSSNANLGYPTSKRAAPRPPGSTGQPSRASSQASLAYSQSGQSPGQNRHVYDNREKY